MQLLLRQRRSLPNLEDTLMVGGSQAVAIRAESQAGNLGLVAVEGECLPAGGQVPHADFTGLIGKVGDAACHREPAAIGAESETFQVVTRSMRAQRDDFSTGAGIPDSYGPDSIPDFEGIAVVYRGDPLAVGAEAHPQRRMRERELGAMAEPPQVMPFKAAEIALAGLRLVPLQKFKNAPSLSPAPGALGQSNVGHVQRAAETIGHSF